MVRSNDEAIKHRLEKICNNTILKIDRVWQAQRKENSMMARLSYYGRKSILDCSNKLLSATALAYGSLTDLGPLSEKIIADMLAQVSEGSLAAV